jgi:hypothetical protein
MPAKERGCERRDSKIRNSSPLSLTLDQLTALFYCEGDKKRGKENAAAPASKKVKADPAAPAAAKEEKRADVKEEEEAVGSGRRAAQGKEYKEKTARTTKDQYILVVEEEEVETEALAFEQTASVKGSGAKRRLVNFTVEIEGSQPLAIDRISISPSAVHLTGIVYPEEGPVAKAKGRKVTQPFGPVKEWKIVYSGDNVSILLKTATAIYEVSKPANKYKATFAELLEQLEICK